MPLCTYIIVYICIINARTVVADDRHDRASFDGYTQHILYCIIYIMAIGHIYRYIIHTPVRTMCGGCCCVRHSNDDDFFLRG